MFFFIGIVQNFFFEKYYVKEKADALKTYMNEYEDMSTKKGTEAASSEFYKNRNVWITKLDKYGSISDVENYYLEVKLKNGPQSELRIPMYSLEEGAYTSGIPSFLKVGDDSNEE
jgi:hypothetical protein